MTAANMITLVRVALIPVFMVAASLNSGAARTVAIIVFVLASLTDGVDGYVARKYNQVTNFGKFIDPLADKLLVLSALLIFLADGIVPVWAVMVILSREFVVTSLRMVAAAEGIVIAAGIWGKIKTFSQIVCIILLFLHVENVVLVGAFTLQDLCVWVMAAVAVISGAVYLKNNFSVIKDGTSKGSKL